MQMCNCTVLTDGGPTSLTGTQLITDHLIADLKHPKRSCGKTASSGDPKQANKSVVDNY